MGPYDGVDHNLTLCPLQSRRLATTHLPWAGNPMPESTSTLGWTWDLASDDSFGLQFVYNELEKDGVRLSSLMKHSAAGKRR